MSRSAVLNGYPQLARSLGIDPAALMRANGLDAACLASQDTWLPAASFARLLEDSACAAGIEDFGLRLAEMRSASNMGPISLAMREEPDLRSALDILCRYEHAHSEALRNRLSEHNGLATVDVQLDFGERIEARQTIELTVAVLHRMIREFGFSYEPVSICFAHELRTDPEVYRRVFGCQVLFNHDLNGIVFYARDLDVPNSTSNPLLRPYASHYLQSVPVPEGRMQVAHVRRIVETLLPTGRCSVGQVARSLGVDRRTMHRHLASASQTYSSVLNSVRVELAERYVSQPQRTFTEITQLLGFAAPSGFTRWFRDQFGCSPRQWRARTQSS